MKRSYRNNIIALTLLHLFLLVFPLVSKTVHVHHGQLTHADYSGQVAFAQPVEYCPIYNFEFYSFISASVSNFITEIESAPLYNSPQPRIPFFSAPNYFSLRAPPLA